MQHNMPGICTRQPIPDEAPKQLEQVSKARARVCVCASRLLDPSVGCSGYLWLRVHLRLSVTRRSALCRAVLSVRLLVCVWTGTG
jgi:hypothetical protein